MSLVETEWLEKNINDVKIIDCSWHMPLTKRNGYEEYITEHISGSLFFDLDKNSQKNTTLPHMLTDKNNWEKIVSQMGINQSDNIIIYNSDVVSSCRCWFNFIYFGHNPNLVHVLNGGLKKWINENKNITITSEEISYFKNEEKLFGRNEVKLNDLNNSIRIQTDEITYLKCIRNLTFRG